MWQLGSVEAAQSIVHEQPLWVHCRSQPPPMQIFSQRPGPHDEQLLLQVAQSTSQLVEVSPRAVSHEKSPQNAAPPQSAVQLIPFSPGSQQPSPHEPDPALQSDAHEQWFSLG